MNLTDLQAFVRVVDEGSFRAAGKVLGVPTSTVSRRVARLEDALETQLLRRAGRAFTVTERGQVLYGRAAPALLEIRDAERALADLESTPHGVLRITAPPDLGDTASFAAMLAAYQARWCEVTLDLDLSGRFVDLVAEGYDLAFRPSLTRPVEGAGLMMRSVGVVQAGLFATPAYLEGLGVPSSVSDLAAHRLLVHASTPPETLGFTTSVPATFVSNDFGPIRWMCLRGAGIAALPSFVVAADVVEGRLTQVLPGAVTGQGRIWLVWPQSRYLAPRVRSFLDFSASWIETHGLFTSV